MIVPDWPAPAHISAFSTTRLGGESIGVWKSLNLGAKCGDDPLHVKANRARLANQLGAEFSWLDQVHGTRVVDQQAVDGPADGVFSRTPDRVCAVLSADCLPVLLCDRHGTIVAALHAGWRGLAAGVIEAGVAAMASAPEGLLAWLGPAISVQHFEVGEDVLAAFETHDTGARAAFHRRTNGKWMADIYALARQRLRALGVDAIYGGECCTYADAERFFSYRRDGVTGRMATGIVIRPI